jgi:hypothetical protein
VRRAVRAASGPAGSDDGVVAAEFALLRALDAGELGDPLAVAAYLAGQRVELPDAESHAARRRALLLLAAAGGLRREPAVDERAVKALAADLHSEERLRRLAAGLDELALLARDLPRAREAVLFLVRDLELAWRLFALGLLAEELSGEPEP